MLLVGSKPKVKCYNSNNIFFCTFFSTNDVTHRALWRHLSSLPHQFSIFEDVGGWQPMWCTTQKSLPMDSRNNYASVSAGWLWIMGNFKTLIHYFLVILGKSFMSWTVWDEEFYRWDGSKSGQQERSLWSFYWWKKQANLCRLLCFTGENKGLKKKFKTSGQPQASATQLLDEVKTALVMQVFDSHSYM